jgi:DNA-binding NtrC family response regulator
VVPVKGGSAAAVAATPGVFGLPYGDAKSRAVAAFEQAYLHDMLARAEGNIAAAARLAGLDRSNFRRLLERYEIDISTHQGD